MVEKLQRATLMEWPKGANSLLPGGALVVSTGSSPRPGTPSTGGNIYDDDASQCTGTMGLADQTVSTVRPLAGGLPRHSLTFKPQVPFLFSTHGGDCCVLKVAS